MLSVEPILASNITIPPIPSNPIAVANDTPDMSAATPSGLDPLQLSPTHKAPTEYPASESENRKQKTPPVNLIFSLIAMPVVFQMA